MGLPCSISTIKNPSVGQLCSVGAAFARNKTSGKLQRLYIHSSFDVLIATTGRDEKRVKDEDVKTKKETRRHCEKRNEVKKAKEEEIKGRMRTRND